MEPSISKRWLYGGLMGAACFADLFGDYERSDQYRTAAERVKKGILTHLWDEHAGRFARGLTRQDGQWVKDLTVESSLFGLFAFGVLSAEDHRVVSTINAISNKLRVQTNIGGIARYTNDYYFRQSHDTGRIPGNPWIICTLWVANFQIETARTADDLAEPRRTLEKLTGFALAGGNLPEQVHPEYGSPISVAQLTWSHATYVQAVCNYVRKQEQLEKGSNSMNERERTIH